MSLEVINAFWRGHDWRSTGGQSLKSTVLDLWMSFYRFLVSGNPNLALKYCSDVTEGHKCQFEGQNWRSIIENYCIGLKGVFSQVLVFGNPNLAVEYQSDVTEGHNCHLEVKIRGHLEVKHLNLLYWTYMEVIYAICLVNISDQLDVLMFFKGL